MSEYLSKYYTNSVATRVTYNNYPDNDGNLLYLPSKGDVAYVFDGDLEMNSKANVAFFSYVRETFGMPRMMQTPTSEVATLDPTSPWMVADIGPEVAASINSFSKDGVSTDYYGLNDKIRFQQIVTDTLGADFSTSPQIVEANTGVDNVSKMCQELLRKEGKIVVRVPDTHVAPGGGMGVRFIHSEAEIGDAIHSIHGLVDDGKLTTAMMLEKFIVSDASPSATFFIEPGTGAIVPLAINYQILEGSTFVAGTNVLPREIEADREEILAAGTAVAEEYAKEGARGFVGFDTLYRQSGKKLTFIEANYRATGSTNPLVAGLRAANHILAPSEIGFVGMRDVDYSTHGVTIDKVVNMLQEQNLLYDKTNDLQRAAVVINYGNQNGLFDLYCVWERNKGNVEQRSAHDEEQFARINEMLAIIGDSRRLSIPTL